MSCDGYCARRKHRTGSVDWAQVPPEVKVLVVSRASG